MNNLDRGVISLLGVGILGEIRDRSSLRILIFSLLVWLFWMASEALFQTSRKAGQRMKAEDKNIICPECLSGGHPLKDKKKLGVRHHYIKARRWSCESCGDKFKLKKELVEHLIFHYEDANVEADIAESQLDDLKKDWMNY